MTSERGQLAEPGEDEMPGDKRRSYGVKELPSVALTTRFLALCEQWGAVRLAVRVVAAGRRAGASELPLSDDWMACRLGAAADGVVDRMGIAAERRLDGVER